MPLAPLVGLSRRLRARPEEIAAFRDKALRRLLAHARREVPFYRERLASADRVRTAHDLALLPIVTKSEMRSTPLAGRLARGADPRRLIEMRSSGSTGEPFDTYRSVGEELTTLLVARRAWRELGFRSGERSVRLGSGFIDESGWRGRLFAALRARAHYRISCKQSPEAILAELLPAKPTVVFGYPGVLKMVARRLEARPHAVSPRFVVSGGEVLTADAQATIERAFGAPVREIYGTFEVGLLGWECLETGLFHVTDDAAVLEVLCDGRPAQEGEEGDVVATALHSRTMPFIRYRLGDRVVRGPSPCPCGRPFSTIASIRGRVIDYFPLADGRLLHYYELFGPATVRAGVRDDIARFQLTQERLDRFVLRVALVDRSRAAVMERLKTELLRTLGAGVEVEIEIVDELAFEPSGKFQVARSLVRVEP